MPSIPNKPFTVAVLACSISDAIEWMKQNFQVREVIGAQRRITLKNGDVYIIVTLPQHVQGWEFHSYIVSPSYKTLEEEVKARVR